MAEDFEGVHFYDMASRREMLLKTWGGTPWLFFRGADGDWVSLREATTEDIESIQAEIARVNRLMTLFPAYEQK